ncbi:MAG: hypothetical protein ACLRIL_11440 [Fusicatenibacter saccharivorans]
MTVLIGSVRDERRLQSMFRVTGRISSFTQRARACAADGGQPERAIKNNVIGTLKDGAHGKPVSVKSLF